MSIDLYSYPIKMQSLDQKSQRTSIQKGGFASMMDVLNQNEAMNQQDNDAFVVPFEESTALPVLPQNKSHETKVDKESAPALTEEKIIDDGAVQIDKEIDISVDVVVTPQVVQVAEMVENIVVDDRISQEIDIPIAPKMDVIAEDDIFLPQESTKSVPVAFSAPTPLLDLPEQIIQVDRVKDVPEVLDRLFPQILSTPYQAAAPVSQEVGAPLRSDVQPEQLQRTMAIPINSIDDKKEPKDTQKSSAPLDRSSLVREGALVHGIDLEEDPKITFVRYVEEESTKPLIPTPDQDRMHVPEGMQPLQEEATTNTAAVAQSTVVGVEKGVAQGLTKSDAVQTNTMLDKNSVKEEVKLPKQKIQQSFAKLLKEAKELAEDFEPKFHADILKKLEIQIKDPSGIIHLEVAQKEAIIHVRAIVPTEAMSDLHYLGQDVNSSLQDLGLQLGSYELRSQDDDEDGSGFGGIEEVGFDELEEADELQSDYVVDKRI
jgi:hypothetical protein